MILEQLKADKIKAMKMHDEVAKSVLTSVLGAVTNAAIAQGCKDNITDELVNTVLLKEKKTMQEMIDTCPAERAETLAAYNEKMKIIKEFAPQLLTDPVEIRASIEAILAEAGIEPVKKNKGLVMKTLMPKFKGKADMGVVNQVIGEVLV